MDTWALVQRSPSAIGAERDACRGDLVLAERRAVRLVRALLGRRALADDRSAGDERRPVIRDRLVERAADVGHVVPVAFRDVPAGRGVTSLDVLAGRQARAAVDGDLVVVPQHDHAAELQVPREPDRLVVDAFHEAAVADDHPGAVVDQAVAELGVEVALGDRHADSHREPLPKRAGGRLDAFDQEVLRVAGARAAELAEVRDLLQRRVRVAREVEQRVDQHRAVAGAEHEPVAVGPLRLGRVELEELAPQHRGDVGHAHRHARMPRIGCLDRVHRQRPDRVGHRRVAGGIEGHARGSGQGHDSVARFPWAAPVAASMVLAEAWCCEKGFAQRTQRSRDRRVAARGEAAPRLQMVEILKPPPAESTLCVLCSPAISARNAFDAALPAKCEHRFIHSSGGQHFARQGSFG